MPYAIDQRVDPDVAAQQVRKLSNQLVLRGEGLIPKITLSSLENQYFDHLIPAIEDAGTGGKGQQLLQSLAHFSIEREAEIESICSTNHQGFASASSQLLLVSEQSRALMTDIHALSQSTQTSTETLAREKKALVESRAVRQNIDEANEALRDCLEVLRLANQVYDLLGRKSHYSALRALDELQDVHLLKITKYKIAHTIRGSIPDTKKLIADAVMTDLNTWLFRIRETSQFLGEVAFYHIEQRRARHKDRAEKLMSLGNFKLNSAVESVADEDEEFDILDNEDVQVDFTPLFECMHIHDALGQREKFKVDYASTRRQQKDLLMPHSITLVDPDGSSLSELLEGIAGFAIIEKATVSKARGLRSLADV